MGYKKIVLLTLLTILAGAVNADIVNYVTIGLHVDRNSPYPAGLGDPLTTGLPPLIVLSEYPQQDVILTNNTVWFNYTISWRDSATYEDYVILNIYDSNGDLYTNVTQDVNNPPENVSIPGTWLIPHTYPQNFSKDFETVFLANGDYTYQWYLISNGGTNFISTPNVSFTVISPEVTTDDRGACTTYQGYSYLYVGAPTDDLIKFDLSGISIVDENLLNVNATVQAWIDGSQNIVLNVTQNQTPIIWIGGTNNQFNYTGFPFTEDKTETLTLTDFTLQNPTYEFYLFEENTGAEYDIKDHEPNTLAVLTGTIESGDISSLYFIDGNRLNITEAAGNVPVVQMNFTDVPGNDGLLQIQTRYEGNPAHVVEIQLWDYGLGAWSSQTVIAEGATLNDYNITLVAANFTQNGIVRVRMDHTSSGASSHFLETEYVHIYVDNPTLVNVLCDNHAPVTIDLDELDRTNFIITAFERPKFEFDNSIGRRVYDSLTDTANVSIYFLTGADVINVDDFQLVDYVGDFTNSYLQIYREINNTLSLVWLEQFENTQVLDVPLRNQTFYQFVLFTPEETRVISWREIMQAETITLTVKQPAFIPAVTYYEGIDIGFTSSYSGSNVGVAWVITNPAGNFVNISFHVEQFTGAQYVNIYNQTVSGGGNSGTITYTVPDQNSSYPVSARICVTGYSTCLSVQDIITPQVRQSVKPYVDGFDFPTEFMGIDKQDLYTGASIFIISLVAMTTTFIGVSIGGLATTGAIGLFYYLGWFEGMTFGLYIFIASMAIAYTFSGGRRPQE